MSWPRERRPSLIAKLLDILRAIALAVTAWFQGRKGREANRVRKAVAEHNREELNQILQERRTK